MKLSPAVRGSNPKVPASSSPGNPKPAPSGAIQPFKVDVTQFDPAKAKALGLSLEPTPNQHLFDLSTLGDVPLDVALRNVETATQGTPDLRLQLVRIAMQTNGQLQIEVDRYNSDQTLLNRATTGPAGALVGQRTTATRDPVGGQTAGDLKFIDDFASARVSFGQAIDKVNAALPGARFNTANVEASTRDGRTVYAFSNSADFAIQPSAEVDVQSGKLTITGLDPKTFQETVLKTID